MNEHWLAAELSFSDGRVQRFGPDERDTADVPSHAEFQTQMPGGFHTASVVLPRPPNLRADDASLFASGRFYGPGSRTWYEGRIAGVPQVGVNEIRLEFEGHVSELDDDETFREIYVDSDRSHWGQAAAERRVLGGLSSYSLRDSNGVVPDSFTGVALEMTVEGPWTNTTRPLVEAWYDAGAGVSIGSLYFFWHKGPTIVTPDTTWWWQTLLNSNSDGSGSSDDSGNLNTAGGPASGGGTLTATTNRRYAIARLFFEGAGGVDQLIYPLWWSVLSVFGDHGLTKRTTADGFSFGFYGSDVISHALGGTSLIHTLGDSIEQSSHVIPHLVFLEPTTRRSVVEQVTALGGAQFVPNDWGVYEDREFFWRAAGTYGKTWRVRGDFNADPSSEGPESKERTSGMMVSYQDGAGKTHSVGPPNSGAEYETTDLLDTDPQNPASRLTKRIKHRSVGITNQEGALNIGRVLLEEANRIDWRGSTTIRGEVRDDAGNLYPTALVRAGDQIVAEDGDGLPHPIAGTSFSQDDLAVKVDVGVPPNRSDVLLAQLLAATELVAT